MSRFFNIDPYYSDQAFKARRGFSGLLVGGFTLVEVMLVLAVGALILLVIFIAIPNLQRNQRNGARSSDVSKISAKVLSFMSNNYNSLPKSQSNCAIVLNNSSPLSHYDFASEISGNLCSAYAIQAAGRFQNLTTPSRFYIYPNLVPPRLAPTAVDDLVILVENPNSGANCNSNNDGVVVGKAGSRAASLLYTRESGRNTYSWACVNVN